MLCARCAAPALYVSAHDCAQVEVRQTELDRLAVEVKQMEAYNERMATEIAVTRRSAWRNP